MTESFLLPFDEYVLMLHDCLSPDELQSVMNRAAYDSRLSAEDFPRLCYYAEYFNFQLNF